jgi:hypothetical protein
VWKKLQIAFLFSVIFQENSVISLPLVKPYVPMKKSCFTSSIIRDNVCIKGTQVTAYVDDRDDHDYGVFENPKRE